MTMTNVEEAPAVVLGDSQTFNRVRIPLDGCSQHPRLVNLRRQAGARVRGEFLTRLHRNPSYLAQARESAHRALNHWFRHGRELYRPDMARSLSSMGLRFLDVLAQGGFNGMVEAERSWDNSNPRHPQVETVNNVLLAV